MVSGDFGTANRAASHRCIGGARSSWVSWPGVVGQGAYLAPLWLVHLRVCCRLDAGGTGLKALWRKGFCASRAWA